MPSLVRTAIIVSVVLSLAHSISAGGRCCPGDNICSGCWMCKGSDLRDCWDQATPMPTKCEAISDLQEKAACYCKGYAAIAKCWSRGTCCTEYAPTLAVATDLCNLASWPSDQITSARLDHCVKEAARVADAIWHNDSGVDVPKAQSSIEPYAGGPVATGVAHVKPKPVHSESYVGSPADPPPPTSSQNRYQKHKSSASHHHPSSHSHLAEKERKKKAAMEKKKQHYEEKKKKKEWEAKQRAKKLADKKWKEHHHQDKGAKHSERGEGCKEKRNHTKRASYTTLNVSPAEMNDMRLGKRNVLCGIDFQGVKHPSTVPELVQKAYDEI
ncbi:uncharacterized protein MELLADRAFT_71192 [Melampsora larici-populina 98AG31]|uniref:Secreted protein n=1 Tax=Melampsora larici-populina (strain 98AG31 / pathotype 3-4-7) TaxID=747676 RepID=F4RD69_MELLP|nr:uncharacterized protein MELLADRAFT_71192 [Melampsora larici-populina 98AG31]EGG09868.1 hypothetical protein MELLADRAFT_71192 [Melampsora larici-populina 98AG31]